MILAINQKIKPKKDKTLHWQDMKINFRASMGAAVTGVKWKRHMGVC